MLLVKYLLGDLSEDEQVRVEDRAFADADYRRALDAAEADLIDAYVRGELLPVERRAFSWLEPRRGSGVGRPGCVGWYARLRAAEGGTRPLPRRGGHQGRRRHAAGHRHVLVGVSPGRPRVRVQPAAERVPQPGLRPLLAFQYAGMRSRVAVLETQRHNLETRTEELQQQLGEEQARAGNLAAELRQQQTASVTPPQSLIASLVLLPGLSRSESRREQLVLNPSTQIAHIEIQLEPRDDYPRFRAELRTIGGDEVLIRGNLPRRSATSGYTVSVDVPASALAMGQYELALKGILNDQSLQDVGYYYFSVQKQ